MADDAQLDDGQRRWTEERVIAELIELSRRGVRLTSSGLRAAGEHRLLHVVSHYGGLPRLRRAAGLPRPRCGWQRCHMTAETVKAHIRQRYRDGRPLAWMKIPRELQNAAQRHFGSWYAAITAAGLDFDRAVGSSR